MAQRYNSASSVRTFNIGYLVSLHIDAKYRKSTTPTKIFCKAIRKPQPDTYELQCLHGISSSKYRTDLERLPATIDLHIGNNTLTCKSSCVFWLSKTHQKKTAKILSAPPSPPIPPPAPYNASFSCSQKKGYSLPPFAPQKRDQVAKCTTH